MQTCFGACTLQTSLRYATPTFPRDLSRRIDAHSIFSWKSVYDFAQLLVPSKNKGSVFNAQ